VPDAKFLNTPIKNYVEMEAIFCGIHATGRYAMGSNEPMGTPTDLGQVMPMLVRKTLSHLGLLSNLGRQEIIVLTTLKEVVRGKGMGK